MKRVVPLLLLLAIAGAYVGYKHYLSKLPFEWAGTVEARSISVGSRTGGRVAKVLVQEGDEVQAGRALLELEHGDLDAQRLGAVAQIVQATALLDKLKAGARPEEIAQVQARAAQASAVLAETRNGSRAEEIAGGAARLEAAQSAVDKAALDAERARRLLATQAIAAAEADAAETALRTAKAQRDVQQKALEQLRAGARTEEKQLAGAKAAEAQAAAKLIVAGSRVEDLRVAQAQVDAAQAHLAQLDVLLAELTIKSPTDARVESLQLRPGDILAPSATAATLLEDGQLYVRLYVPETEIGKIKIGEEVPIAVDSFEHAFKGVVQHINTQGEYSPRNLQTADERADQVFAARIGLIDGKHELRAGMAATIRVPK